MTLRRILLVITLILSIFYGEVRAQSGCLIGNTVSGTIYTGSYSIDAFGRRTYSAVSTAVPLVCPSQSASITHASDLEQVYNWIFTISCRVGGGSYTGTVYSYTLLQCPLDDYIWLLILPLGVFATNMLRKRNLNLFTAPALLA